MYILLYTESYPHVQRYFWQGTSCVPSFYVLHVTECSDQVLYSTPDKWNSGSWRDQPITAVIQLLLKLGGRIPYKSSISHWDMTLDISHWDIALVHIAYIAFGISHWDIALWYIAYIALNISHWDIARKTIIVFRPSAIYADTDILLTMNMVKTVAMSLIRPIPSKLKPFVWHVYNVGATAKTLSRRCANVIQLLCVCWLMPIASSAATVYWVLVLI